MLTIDATGPGRLGSSVSDPLGRRSPAGRIILIPVTALRDHE
jgi:hypothetical protein